MDKKYIIKFFPFFTALVALVILFGSFFLFNYKAQAQGCGLKDVIFEPSGRQPDNWWDRDQYKRLTFSVTLVGDERCRGQTWEEVTLANSAGYLFVNDIADFEEVPVTFNADSTRIKLTFWVGEEGCDATKTPDCELFMRVKTPAGTIDSIGYLGLTFPNGVLSYICDNRFILCDNSNFPIKFVRVEGGKVRTSATAPCRLNATLSPSGTQRDGWYKDDRKPDVGLAIDLLNPPECWGKQIEVNLISNMASLTTLSGKVPIRRIIVPRDIEKINLSLKAGESKCSFDANPDCQYYINITGATGRNGVDTFDSKGKKNGELKYNCDGPCLDNWQFLSQNTNPYQGGGGGIGGGRGGTGGGRGGGGDVPGQPISFQFEITNPLKAESFTDLVKAIGKFIFDISIPIAVVLIIYSGILFFISQGEKEKVVKARKTLLYTLLGLLIILIGRGFITLIKSILDLGK